MTSPKTSFVYDGADEHMCLTMYEDTVDIDGKPFRYRFSIENKTEAWIMDTLHVEDVFPSNMSNAFRTFVCRFVEAHVNYLGWTDLDKQALCRIFRHGTYEQGMMVTDKESIFKSNSTFYIIPHHDHPVVKRLQQA